METTLPPPRTPPPPRPPHPPTSAPTPPPPPPAEDGAPDRSRAGATWVTGTGAFLLLAAAGVFVAVRWDHLSDHVKLAILGAATGGFLLAGRRIRRDLPATGGVLFHLGALLIPLNVATVVLHAELPWSQVLLVEGAVATVAWFLLDRVEPSAVLRWATGAAFVVAAAGVAAEIGVPTALVLALAALAAHLLGAPKPALGWAAVAGLGPVAVFAESWSSGTEVVASLGLAPTAPGVAWTVSGAIAAAVIAREAARRTEPMLLVPAITSLLLGIGATWSVLDPSLAVEAIGAAATFLAIEIVAGLTRRDPFWRGPTRTAAVGTEALAALAVPAVVLVTWWWFVDGRGRVPRHGELAVAALLGAAGWLAGDLRRIAGRTGRGALASTASIGSGWSPASLGIAMNVLVAVALLSGSSVAVGVAMVAVAAAFVLTGRAGGHGAAVVLAVLAPLLASFDLSTAGGVRWSRGAGRFDLVPGADRALVVIAALSIGGALVVAAAAVVRARMADPADNGPLAWCLGVAALGPVAVGSCVLAGPLPPLGVLVGAAVTAWAIAMVLDRGEPLAGTRRGIVHLGGVGRAGALLVLLGADLVGARGTMVLAALLSAAFVTDAARRRSELPLLGLAVTLPVLVGAVGAEAGLTTSEIGVALTMLAAAAAGAHLLAGDRRGWPLVAVVLASGAAGLGLAATASSTRWLALLALAGIGLAYSTVHASSAGGAVSALAAVTATWGLLGAGGVDADDAYLAPVAVVLVVAGTIARRSNRVSSWVAYAPAIILLGGSALYERVSGGGGIHALAAGAVAAVAVVAGGARRLAAPLLLGTALLVGLTAHESLAVTREVPTWAWLAIGGSVLVVAGIVMERRDTTPMETGRRLVDVVGTRFR